MRSRSTKGRWLAAGWIGLALAASAGQVYWAQGPDPYWGLVGRVLLLASPVAALLMALARTWRSAVVALVPLLLFVPTRVLVERAHRSAWLGAAERTQPVIDQIRQYAVDHGRLPERLDDLVPGYLAELPTTGLRVHRELGYWTEGGRWGFEVQCGRTPLTLDRFAYPAEHQFNLDGRIRAEVMGDWMYWYD